MSRARGMTFLRRHARGNAPALRRMGGSTQRLQPRRERWWRRFRGVLRRVYARGGGAIGGGKAVKLDQECLGKIGSGLMTRAALGVL